MEVEVDIGVGGGGGKRKKKKKTPLIEVFANDTWWHDFSTSMPRLKPFTCLRPMVAEIFRDVPSMKLMFVIFGVIMF